MIGARPFAAMPSALLAAVLVAIYSWPVAAQQLYRWTDEKGAVHITDTPPPPTAKGVQKPKATATAPASTQEPFALAQVMKEFPVTLYTAPSCKEPCDQARGALNRRGVPFKEIQVWEEETSAELKKLTGGSNDVPVLLVGRSVQKGFQQDAFDALLDSARYPRAGLLPARTQGAPKPPEDYVPPGQRQAPPQAEAVKPTEESRPAGPYAPRPAK